MINNKINDMTSEENIKYLLQKIKDFLIKKENDDNNKFHRNETLVNKKSLNRIMNDDAMNLSLELLVEVLIETGYRFNFVFNDKDNDETVSDVRVIGAVWYDNLKKPHKIALHIKRSFWEYVADYFFGQMTITWMSRTTDLNPETIKKFSYYDSVKVPTLASFVKLAHAIDMSLDILLIKDNFHNKSSEEADKTEINRHLKKYLNYNDDIVGMTVNESGQLQRSRYHYIEPKYAYQDVVEIKDGRIGVVTGVRTHYDIESNKAYHLYDIVHQDSGKTITLSEDFIVQIKKVY